MSRNDLFVKFMGGLLIVLILYGCGMFGVIIWGSSSLASKMLVGFATMFTGILGLGSGFLLGKTNGENHVADVAIGRE